MYGILLIRQHGLPEMVTAARSRADFLAALKLRDTPRNWNRAVSEFAIAREVSGFRGARRALEEVRRACPQYYLDCRFLLGGFLRDSVLKPGLPPDIWLSGEAKN